MAIASFGGMILMTDLGILGLAMRTHPAVDVAGQLRVPKRYGFLRAATCGVLMLGCKAEEYYYNVFFRAEVVLLLLVIVHALVFHGRVYVDRNGRVAARRSWRPASRNQELLIAAQRCKKAEPLRMDPQWRFDIPDSPPHTRDAGPQKQRMASPVFFRLINRDCRSHFPKLARRADTRRESMGTGASRGVCNSDSCSSTDRTWCGIPPQCDGRAAAYSQCDDRAPRHPRGRNIYFRLVQRSRCKYTAILRVTDRSLTSS
jgi:hypothetical protein